jgi:hypothetical protein
MSVSDDPFSLTYDALVGMLQEHADLTALVKVGNMVSLSGTNRAPFKAEVMAADLPELRLVPTGGVFQYHGPSGKCKFTKNFSLEIATGEQRITEATSIYPVQWQAIRALAAWQTVFPTVLHNGAAFLTSLLAWDVQEGVTNTDLNRGIKGWSTVLGCEVAGFLPRASVIPA